MSFWDDITGKSAAEATEKGMEAQLAAGREAQGFLQEGYDTATQALAPYTQAAQTGLGGIQDLVLGRRYEDDPVLAQLGADRIEMGERQMRGAGLGGGARLKRLMQMDAQNQMAQRQQRLGEFNMLMGANSPAATNQANLAMGQGQGMGNLATQMGSAEAAGLIGQANARAAGIGNILQLGGTAAGAVMGGPQGAAMGSQIGSSFAPPQQPQYGQAGSGAIQAQGGGFLDIGF